jgi:hypothetical protein
MSARANEIAMVAQTLKFDTFSKQVLENASADHFHYLGSWAAAALHTRLPSSI